MAQSNSQAGNQISQSASRSRWVSTSQLPGYSRQPRPPVWTIAKLLAYVAVATASVTVGLAAAMIVPLPTGVHKAKGGEMDGMVWQTGFGYQVSRPVNILFMGIDLIPDAQKQETSVFDGRSDTMLLLRVDPTQDSVSVLSIPRDTQVHIPDVGVTKINDANVRGGAILAAETVSRTLNGVPIDRYVRVSTEAFRELVDLLGGIEVNVPMKMSYVDQTQKLNIQLEPGLQTLNGNQAEQFARFRADGNGDIGRVQRQQSLLRALRGRLTSPEVIPRIPALIQAMQKYVDTNLSLEELLALANAGRNLGDGKLKMVMLPGRFSAPGEFIASYWIMNLAGRDRVMEQFFDIYPPDVQTIAEATGEAHSLRIAIQNASGQPHAGSQFQQYLAQLGFDNAYVSEDSPSPQSETRIVAQQGDLNAAGDVQRQLGFGKVEADSTGDLDSDLTIRVGSDWATHRKL